jgi:hypothetical protein
MKMRLLYWSLLGVVIGLLVACANTASTGGESETNWLKTCAVDADCSVGACLCGRCTEECEPGGDCAGGPPGSQCVAASSAASCAFQSTAPTALCLGQKELVLTPLPAPDGGVCGPNEFLDKDMSCPPPVHGPDAGPVDPCEPEGDSLCHQRCTSNADCSDPSRPFCGIQGVFAGFDYNCDVGVRICRERPGDDCPRVPPELL